MAEVHILLERPASLTPELRAWINHRLGYGRVVLTRGQIDGSDRSGLLLRVELSAESEAAREDELVDLLTDLRLLGLRPTLLSEQAA